MTDKTKLVSYNNHSALHTVRVSASIRSLTVFAPFTNMKNCDVACKKEKTQSRA